MNQQTASAFLTSCYNELNTAYFDGSLRPAKLYIVQHMPGKAVGLCQYDSDTAHISLLKRLFAPSAPGAKRLIADVLLHEMVHQHLYEQGYLTHDHDSACWLVELERLCALIGLSVPVQWTRFQRQSFPHALTNVNYYQGAERKSGVTVLDLQFLPAILGKPLQAAWYKALTEAWTLSIAETNAGHDDFRIALDISPQGIRVSIEPTERRA